MGVLPLDFLSLCDGKVFFLVRAHEASEVNVHIFQLHKLSDFVIRKLETFVNGERSFILIRSTNLSFVQDAAKSKGKWA